MPKTALIVDDAGFMRAMLRGILTENGYQVVGEAVNGRQAVEEYRRLRPDFTTMDITMPEMDGLAALSAIRDLDPDAIVIMCSALGQHSMVVEAIRRGAVDFVVKPFQPDRVLEAVSRALGAPHPPP
ncbi:response regulator [bacterium]|nr:response regulator [bacterium]